MVVQMVATKEIGPVRDGLRSCLILACSFFREHRGLNRMRKLQLSSSMTKEERVEVKQGRL